MELTQLKYFIEVAKRQHVTKAAEALNVAQPALSQSIHRLENELGVKLFNIQGRNICLNPYGEYFFMKVDPLISELDNLPAQIKKMAKTENSTIHLNVLAASTLITEAIIEYQKIDGDVHFQLMQNEKESQYDICVTTRRFNQISKNTEDETKVFSERIFLAVPQNKQFKEKNKISLNEAKDEGFISLLGSRQLRSICDEFCQDAHIKPNIVFESDSPAAVRNMIAAKMGVGFWPEFSWGEIDTSKVKLMEITNPVCSREIVISIRRNKQDNSKLDEFYKFLSDYITERSARHQ